MTARILCVPTPTLQPTGTDNCQLRQKGIGFRGSFLLAFVFNNVINAYIASVAATLHSITYYC